MVENGLKRQFFAKKGNTTKNLPVYTSMYTRVYKKNMIS